MAGSTRDISAVSAAPCGSATNSTRLAANYSPGATRTCWWVTNQLDDEIVDHNGLSPRQAIHGRGRIFCDEIEAVRPRSRTMTWHWHIPYPGQLMSGEHVSFPDPPTTLRFEFVELRDDKGVAHTAVTVEHALLPVEWLEQPRPLASRTLDRPACPHDGRTARPRRRHVLVDGKPGLRFSRDSAGVGRCQTRCALRLDRPTPRVRTTARGANLSRDRCMRARLRAGPP